MAQPNGVKTAYTYDLLRRLDLETVGRVAGTTTTPLASLDYDLRTDGKRTGVTEVANTNTGTVFSTTRIDWTYDGLGRLDTETYTERDGSNTVTRGFKDDYNLDLVGNRTKQTHDEGNNASMSSAQDFITLSSYVDGDGTSNRNDQLTKETKAPGTGPVLTTDYVYDPNGSTTTVTQTGSPTQVSTYDLRNRLKSVDNDNNGTVDVALAYASDNVRVSETVGATVKKQLIDRRNPTGYAQTIEEYTGTTLTRSYAIGQDMLAQADSAGTRHLQYDGHGSTRFLTDASGSLLTTGTIRFTYNAFGTAYGFDPGTAGTSLLYNGERWTASLNTYYFRARDYRPTQGRFPTKDDFIPGVGELADWNGYVFVGGDPTNSGDPSGYSSYNDVTATMGIITSLSAATVFGGSYFLLHHTSEKNLRPNWGGESGPMHHALHGVTLTFPSGTGSASVVASKIYDDLALFNHWGFNSVSNVRVAGKFAFFDSKGFLGYAADRLNADEVAVELVGNSTKNEVSAVTLGSHMLVGMRKWRVKIVSESPVVLEVETEAYEQANGSTNRFGGRLVDGINDSQSNLWKEYLNNIASHWSGTSGAQSSGAALKYDRKVDGGGNPWKSELPSHLRSN